MCIYWHRITLTLQSQGATWGMNVFFSTVQGSKEPILSWRSQTSCLKYVYVFLDAANLTEVFPWFFLGCKANARVILAKTGHGPHSSKIVVLFYVLFVLYCSMYCLCVSVYCHRVTTQLQLTNISYHIFFWGTVQ